MHIRTGDQHLGINNAQVHTRFATQERDWYTMVECAKHLANNSRSGPRRIFVATDSTDVRRVLNSKYGDAVTFGTETTKHLDRSKHMSPGDVVDTLVDMFVLAGAEALVMSHSGYSHSARAIGGVARALEKKECIAMLPT